MLKSVDDSKDRFIKEVPHKKEFESWRNKMNDADYMDIIEALNNRIDNSIEDIHTAGWIPGHDWSGTVYQPIYEACGKNFTKAALFFGLIVFQVFIDREELWYCGRFDLRGESIRSMTYFKPKNQR